MNNHSLNRKYLHNRCSSGASYEERGKEILTPLSSFDAIKLEERFTFDLWNLNPWPGIPHLLSLC